MSKRICSAFVAVGALAAGLLVSVEAHAHRGGHAGAGTSRACLTAAARSALARIEAQFGAMRIVSTCRPGARIAGTGRRSLHASGNAIDFDAGARKGEVIRWLIANHSGGVMTYPRMGHIHVDVGPRFVSLGGTRVAGGFGRRVGGGTGRALRASGLSRRASRSHRRYVAVRRAQRVTWRAPAKHRAGVRYARTTRH